MSSKDASNGIKEEICPVCKQSSYLNPSIRFLINPECYHRMCEGCVDRRFSSGPKQCPVIGCGKTLRRHRFRKQTFEDLTIEREVDIRRRVNAILNRREDEFETKRDWDDYLERREEMIMNLVLGTDVEQTEKQLEDYKAANQAEIRANMKLEQEESNDLKALQAEEELLAKARRDATRQADEAERRVKQEERLKTLDQMASGQYDPTAAAKERSSKTITALKDTATVKSNLGTGLTFSGIRKRPTAHRAVEKDYDPFMGLPIKRDYYTLQDDYPSKTLTKAKNDTRVLAGGYSFAEYYDESLLKAFAGLGCFIEDEIRDRDRLTAKSVETATAAEL